MLGIIGGGGYIGRNLAVFLGENRIGYELIGGDVTCPWFADGIDFGLYDAIYYLAGITGVERSFDRPGEFFSVNVGGLINLCQAISKCAGRAPKVIFPSSRLVYRGGTDISEDGPIEARSVYAASKISGEAILSAYSHRFGMPYCALRIGQVFGNDVKGCVPNGVRAIFERQAAEGGPVTVYGDGAAMRTWTHIRDLCAIMARVADDNVPSGVYNVGGVNDSIESVASSTARKFGAEVLHCEWPGPARAAETGNATLDSSKLDIVLKRKVCT